MSAQGEAGHVWLVGAGPGDPGLVTQGGLEALRRAEVVLYDRLGTAELLAECAPEAELINAGKAPGGSAMTQDEINAALVHQARMGKRVVRLKGGDPFVFGRGGEELEALAEAGLEATVVPGVTSAIGGWLPPASRSRIAASPSASPSSPATRTPPSPPRRRAGPSWPRPSTRSSC